MTLGQFAVAVAATPRWVLNARSRLKVRRAYSEPLARRLALARFLAEGSGMPLLDAWPLAGEILAGTEMTGTWSRESPGGVTLCVELPRFFTTYGANLALAINKYGERLRGRRNRKRKSAVQRAKEYGVDVTLIDSALRRNPEERLRMVSEDMAFLSEIRGTLR
ncbi:MAG: hypothetical protein Q8Q85_07435 [Gemmatimonadales bacterium]|nr:hypothetical protein [Gemmatimonadales bacterium]